MTGTLAAYSYPHYLRQATEDAAVLFKQFPGCMCKCKTLMKWPSYVLERIWDIEGSKASLCSSMSSEILYGSIRSILEKTVQKKAITMGMK